MSKITEKFLRLSSVTPWGSNFIRCWPPRFNIKGRYSFLMGFLIYVNLGYFCLMDDLYDLPDNDICQPEWLADFIQNEFPSYLYHYNDEFDFTDFVYPIESDGIVEYFYQSQISEIMRATTSDEVMHVVCFLRSIDLLQREYLPSKHLDGLRFLVSFSRSL